MAITPSEVANSSLSIGARPRLRPNELTPSQLRVVTDLIEELLELARRRQGESDLRQSSAAVHDHYARPHEQFFLLEGPRGTGKTTTFLTLRALIDQAESRRMAFGDLAAWSKALEGLADRDYGALGELQRCCWSVHLQPADLGRHERIMERLFGALQNELATEIARCAELHRPTHALDEQLSLLQTKVFPTWSFAVGLAKEVLSRDALDYRDYGSQHARMSADSERRVDEWRRWIHSCLNAMDRTLLLVFVDDLDLDGRPVEDMLQSMRLYLDHPRLVVVWCGDMGAIDLQLRAALCSRSRLSSGNSLPEPIQADMDLLADVEASALLAKVLPPQSVRRVFRSASEMMEAEAGATIIKAFSEPNGSQPLRLWARRLEVNLPRGPMWHISESLRDVVSFTAAFRRAASQPKGVGAGDGLSDMLWSLMSLPSLAEVASLVRGRRGSQPDFVQAYLSAVQNDEILRAMVAPDISNLPPRTQAARVFFELVVGFGDNTSQRRLVANLMKAGVTPQCHAITSSWLERISIELPKSELDASIPVNAAPSNLDNIADWLVLLKDRNALATEDLQALDNLATLVKKAAGWTRVNQRVAAVHERLVVDDHELYRRFALEGALNALENSLGQWVAEPQRLPSRTLLAWMLWQWYRRDSLPDKSALPSDPEHFWKASETWELLRNKVRPVAPFWGFVADYEVSDLSRQILADILVRQLSSAWLVDQWRRERDELTATAPTFDTEPQKWLPLLWGLTRKAMERCLAHWLSAESKVERSDSKTDLVSKHDISLLRACWPTMTLLLRLRPQCLDASDLQMVLKQAHTLRKSTEKLGRPALLDVRWRTLAHPEEAQWALSNLISECQRALTPWEKLSIGDKLRRLNPFDVQPSASVEV